MTSKLTAALAYVKHGFSVYPLAENTKTPIKGSHGFNSATTDLDKIKALWEHHNYNIGLALQPSHLLVFDIDRQHKNNVDGLASYDRLEKERGFSLPIKDTYIEATPRGGLHVFLSYPENATTRNVVDAFFPDSGLDIITTGVPVWPTTTNSMYKPLKDRKLNKIAPAPNWLLEYLVSSSNKQPDRPTKRKLTYTGQLLNAIIAGTAQGNRNDYLTRLCGQMLATGAASSVVYELLSLTNEHLQPPLPDKELNTIFKSILQREVRNT